MTTLFNSRQNASVLPVLAALMTTLFFNPAAAKAQFTNFGAGQTPGMGDPDMAGIVGELEQSALMALIGAVVFIGLVWICYVSKECARLSKPQENARRPFMTLLILVAALSVFCGSCTVEQRAMAAQYRATADAERGTCPSLFHTGNDEDSPFNNSHPYDGYSGSGYGPSFCKHCGQRIYNGRH
jgi:hypothetical protein